MAQHEVKVPGLAGRVSVTTPGLIRGAQIYIDGAPAKKGGWGKVQLQRVDGSVVEAKLVDHMTRTIPSIQIGTEKYQFGEKIPMLLVVLLFLPFGLVGVGGALGGASGGLAFIVNHGVVRSERPLGVKAAIMVGVLLAAIVLYIAVASVLFAAVN